MRKEIFEAGDGGKYQAADVRIRIVLDPVCVFTAGWPLKPTADRIRTCPHNSQALTSRVRTDGCGVTFTVERSGLVVMIARGNRSTAHRDSSGLNFMELVRVEG